MTTTRIITDGVALHNALRAALAIAPGGQDEHAVVAVDVPATDQGVVSVSARNPRLGLAMTVTVPTEDVDLVDTKHEHLELALPSVRQLLSMKIKPTKEDEPWPSVSWDVTDDGRIIQTDANVLLGRSTTVRHEDIAQHVLTGTGRALATAADGIPAADGSALASAKQLKAVATAFGHLGEDPVTTPLETSGEQRGALLLVSASAIAHAQVVNEEAGKPEADPAASVSFDDDGTSVAEFRTTRGTLRVVGANPSGGIA